ncbi:hypothetical protein H2199_003104 [Coniosporium tulheliwenetii]|uniref:Uncharacterized protein n=1 Tax=Coniosporium tulheliwenetii TaxID=3383036 RepID=A0ACC2ZCV7_9PEZI|nr:hypothetical protein H2199_003104 [Cladosporium sp. JES 115]
MARLAFGRSAFEPPEAETQSTSHNAPSAQDTEGSSQTLDPGDAASGEVQQYDERGHPINPRSRELARQLRRAKNDVLAAAGVVVRKIPRSTEGATGEAVTRRISQDDYDAESNALTFASWMAVVLRISGTWWISSLRDRSLVSPTNNEN